MNRQRLLLILTAPAACWLAVIGGSAASAADATYVSYPLRHAAAADLEPTLNGLLGADAQQTRVVVDVRANQLLVSAPPAVHRLVAQLIARLDQPPAKAQPPAWSPAGVVPAGTGPQPALPADDRYVQRTVGLRNATAANIEALLRELLGARLQPRTSRGTGLT
ncbi:MAG: hypothetical protein JNG90_13785, partial [Planctomycetaceae bacterium]|nr:hypothetical protein [Planctomycetaceae bacterium]